MTDTTSQKIEAMYVPMPLDADGNGPADATDTVRVEHQVWDAVTNETLCTAKDEDTARAMASTWNRRPAVNIALPKPALAQPDGYTTADELKAVIRQWLDGDDPTAWGPFERALDGLVSGEPYRCPVCGCLSLDGKAYFPARKGAKP